MTPGNDPTLLQCGLSSGRAGRVLINRDCSAIAGWASGRNDRALRDNAFEAELAGMGENGRAVTLDMLVEPDAGAGVGTEPKLERYVMGPVLFTGRPVGISNVKLQRLLSGDEVRAIRQKRVELQKS